MAYLLNALHEEVSVNLSQNPDPNAPAKQIDYSNPEEYITSSLLSSCSPFSERFQGLFSSEIKCPTCLHSSTQYDQFNMVSLPLYSKEDHYNIIITYIPHDLTQSFVTKTYKFCISQNTTLDEFLEIMREDLHIFNEIPLLSAIVEDDIIDEILKDKTMLLKDIKSKLELKRKRFVAYDMPLDWDSKFDHIIQVTFSTEIRKAYSGLSLKKPFGVPRLIILKPQPIYEDIYLSIMEMLNGIYPDHISQFNQLKQNLAQNNLELVNENSNTTNSSKIKKEPTTNKKNGKDQKECVINSEDLTKKNIEEENSLESQTKEMTITEQPKPMTSKGKGKGKKGAPRVCKRKKHENENSNVIEEPTKIKESSIEKSSSKKDAFQIATDPETLLQDFVLNLPYFVKFVNKMKNIHACLLCNKKNCDYCPMTLNTPLPLMDLLDRCQTNQLQMELNLFFRNDVPKALEQTLESTSSNNSAASGNANPTLEQCIELFSEKEVLSSENMWFCPSCNEKKQAEKAIQLFYVSKYLIFHLKRFKTLEGDSAKNRKKVKNNQPIDYPINDLDMTGYVKNVVPHLRVQNEKNIKYKLIAVVLHEGKLDEGHYIAMGRCKDGMWRKFDDDKVQEVSEKEVCHKNAYLLFYELY